MGEVTVTASAGSVSAAEAIEILPKGPESVILRPNVGGMYPGFSLDLSAIVFVDRWPVDDPELTWSSSDPLVATVDDGGVVTAVAPGTVTISAEQGGTVGTAAITVVERPIPQWNPDVGDWGFHQGNLAHTGYVPVTLDPTVFRERWTAAGVNSRQTLATGAGKVFALDEGPAITVRLVALDGATGALAWEQPVIGVVHPQAPAFDGGEVYVVVSRGAPSSVLSFDAATGASRFQSSFYPDPWPYHAPVVFDGVVVVGGMISEGGGIGAFSTADGTHLWSQGVSRYSGFKWTPAVRNGLVYAYATHNDRAVYVFDGATGDLEYAIPDPGNVLYHIGVESSPVLGGQNNLLVTHGRRLISFDLQNRTIGWVRTDAFHGNVVVANGVLYVQNMGEIEARQESDGELLWVVNLPEHSQSTLRGMIATDNLLFVSVTNLTGRTGQTYAIDLAARMPTWVYPAGGSLALSADGMLVIAKANNQQVDDQLLIAIDVMP